MISGRHVAYLDNNATTQVANECIDAIVNCLRTNYGNPSSKHFVGQDAKTLLNEARRHVAEFINARPAEIVFTSGGTESNHLAIYGALAMKPGKNHIVASAVEHGSTLALLQQLEAVGVRVTLLPVDRAGRLSLDDLAAALRPDTALVSLMWANNETGVLFPVADAAALVKDRGILFHTDAVQGAGKSVLDMNNARVDMLSLSGHKLHAPKGVGALFVRSGVKLPPLLCGQQERGRRGGTENLPGIVGMGVACAVASESRDSDEAHVAALRNSLEDGLRVRFPYVRINGADATRIANTSNVCFGNMESEAILHRLERAGICASSGAACSVGSSDPSHVLRAMGLSDAAALASVRFSFSRYNTAADVELALAALTDALAKCA